MCEDYKAPVPPRLPRQSVDSLCQQSVSSLYCLGVMESGSGCCCLKIGFHPLLGKVVTHRIICFLDFVHGLMVVYRQHISETVSKMLCSLNDEPKSRNQVLTYHHQTLI